MKIRFLLICYFPYFVAPKEFAQQVEAVPAHVAMAQSETLRSDDLDTTPTSIGKFSYSRFYCFRISPSPKIDLVALATSIAMTFENLLAFVSI